MQYPQNADTISHEINSFHEIKFESNYNCQILCLDQARTNTSYTSTCFHVIYKDKEKPKTCTCWHTVRYFKTSQRKSYIRLGERKHNLFIVMEKWNSKVYARPQGSHLKAKSKVYIICIPVQYLKYYDFILLMSY